MQNLTDRQCEELLRDIFCLVGVDVEYAVNISLIERIQKCISTNSHENAVSIDALALEISKLRSRLHTAEQQVHELRSTMMAQEAC